MALEDYHHLLNRIRQINPALDPNDMLINGDGLANVVMVSGGTVYRFARDDHAINDLVHEVSILNLSRQYVTMTVPDFTIRDRDFVSYPFLSGEPLFRNTILRLSELQQAHLASQLAQFLGELHSIPLEVLRNDNIRQSGGRQTQADWLEFYYAVRQELFPLMYRSTKTWVEDHFAPLLKRHDWLAYEPSLIHDDLAQYHILYDAQTASIKAIIDFGTAGLGDPARDYAMLINTYGETFVSRLANDDHRIRSLIDRARFYAGTFELQWLLGGVRSGDHDWFTAHIDRARDVLPYGQPLSNIF